MAKSTSDYTAALAALDKLPSSFKLEQGAIAPATISPFVWGADYDGNTVKLTGFVNGAEQRHSVIAAMKKALPQATISDEMRIAAGASDNFQNAARFASNQLTRFSSGSVGLSDRALAIRGVAKSSKDYKAAKIAISSGLPGDMTLASENVSPPVASPYTWEANHNGKTLNLTGFVPSDEVRGKILAKAKTAFPSLTIADEMEIADGAPKSFYDATTNALDRLPGLSSGSVSLVDQKMAIKGVANSSTSFAQSKASLAGALPFGLTLGADEVVPPTIDPYSWDARYDGKQAVLSGFVPSETVRAKIA